MFKELNTLKIFFEEPTREFSVREAAGHLKTAPATASKNLKILASRGLLKERTERAANLYKANLDSENFLDMKKSYNIRKLKESGLIEALNDFYLKPAIILFGSFATGLDTENSDIDLVVVSEKIKEFPERKRFEKKLKRPLQIFAVKNIKDLKNEHLINNVLNGTVIQGRVKWI